MRGCDLFSGTLCRPMKQRGGKTPEKKTDPSEKTPSINTFARGENDRALEKAILQTSLRLQSWCNYSSISRRRKLGKAGRQGENIRRNTKKKYERHGGEKEEKKRWETNKQAFCSVLWIEKLAGLFCKKNQHIRWCISGSVLRLKNIIPETKNIGVVGVYKANNPSAMRDLMKTWKP